MARKRSAVDADLQRVYDVLPEMECKGLCQEACGPIEMSVHERQRLKARGITLEPVKEAVPRILAGGDYTCPALTDEGRCSVYEIRPLICRLWGQVENMVCEFGCVPEGGHLTREAGARLLRATLDIGGDSE